jgi:histidine triad (HIT) family protein
MTDPDCVFCKIASGEIPCETTLYEDDTVIAFPDKNPKAAGHSLLIPKAHYQWFYELPDKVSDLLFRIAKKLAPELMKKHGADLIQVSIVGTEIPHTHMHLIPRTFRDAPK